MAIKQTYHYRVAGVGPFPIDMLRYDSAWPASEADAGLIHATLDDHLARRATGRVEIALVGIDPPTAGRWNSFGWAAGAAEIVRV